MKPNLFKFFMPLLILVSTTLYSQSHKTISFPNVSEDIVWEVVYKTFKDLNLKHPSINKQSGLGETPFFNYSTLLAKNRAKYKISYENNTLSIAISNRQYISNNKWADNLLPMSKKQASKYLNPIKKHITSLLNNKEFIAQVSTKNTPNTTAKLSKKGVFKNFTIAKTTNQQVNLFTFHENGNVMGVELSSDKTTIKSLVFQENEKSDKTTMLFNDDGFPKAIIANEFIVKITPKEDKTTELSIFDKNGTIIKKASTTIESFANFTSSINASKPTNGPSIFEVNFNLKEDKLSVALGYASLALKSVTCAASLTTVVGALAPCTALLLDVLQRVSEEDAFYYDELELANNVFGLIPFNNPLKTIENLMHVVDGMSYVLTGATNIYNELFPEGSLIITGKATVLAGGFGEIGKEHMVLYAKTNYPDIPIKWSIESDAIFLYSSNNEDSLEATFKAKETKSENHYVIATLIVKNSPISFRKKITVVNPKYYYFPWPDCDELHDNKILTDDEAEKCLNQKDDCLMNLKPNDVLLANEPRIVEALLKEHIIGGSVLTDPAMRLTSEKLNMVRKIYKEDGLPYTGNEAGEFRNFVKLAPCMANWSGIGDKREIIILANEALLKIEHIESKIKGLQKTVNETNYQQISAEIKSLEKSIEAIKENYTLKVKKIAQKRTISYPFIETDKDESKANYKITGNEIMDFKWGKYGGPTLEMEIFFTPKQTTKTINNSVFNQNLSELSFTFQDNSDKPTKYTLLINESIRKEQKVKTAIRIKLFEKDIETIDFNRSRARHTKIK